MVGRSAEFVDRTAHARDAILQMEHDLLFLQPDHGPTLPAQKAVFRPILCALPCAGMRFPVIALNCNRALSAPYREIKTISFCVSVFAVGNIVLGNRLDAGSRKRIPRYFFGRRNAVQLQNIFRGFQTRERGKTERYASRQAVDDRPGQFRNAIHVNLRVLRTSIRMPGFARQQLAPSARFKPYRPRIVLNPFSPLAERNWLIKRKVAKFPFRKPRTRNAIPVFPQEDREIAPPFQHADQNNSPA